MIKLIIEDDEGKTTVVPLIRDEISIGRKEGNTIRLTERNVSRRHARLLKNNGTVFIEDLNSYNGIKVNGNKISGRVAITEGDRIQIGDYVLGLKLEGVSAARSDKAPEDAETTKVPEGFRPGAGGGVAEVKTEQIEVTETMQTTELPRTDVAKEVARLVCVSVNFAGMEFRLNRPVMVLGRTDDNDLVINHRSISRHHCRVVEENGRYSMIDLQSANGVRVNGEEYKEVELRRGDHIDLGHVRLRFVASSEDFDFDRDAVVVDTSKPSGTSSSGVWLGVVVVALVAIAVLVWRVVIPGGGSTAAQPDLGSADNPPTKKRTAPDQPQPDASKLLDAIRSAMDNESWSIVLEHCGKLEGEAKERAAEDCRRARGEQTYKRVFEDAVSKTRQLAIVEALQQFNSIPDDSSYGKKRADTPEYREAQAKYRAQMMPAIKDHVAKGECDQAAVKAAAVKKLLPDDLETAALADKCEPRVVASAPTPRRPRPKRPKTPQQPPPQQPETPTAELIQKANELLDKARGAYVVGQYAKAIGLARKVLTLQPARRDAEQILGASACYTGDVKLAKKSYRRLDASRRQLLRNVCDRKGITLD